MGWGRLLTAAWWLADGARPVEAVAHALGYADAPGLRHMLARYTGLRVGEVRAAGSAVVVGLFAAALARGTIAAPAPGDVVTARVT